MEPVTKFFLNDYLTLKLEDGETILYVGGERFDQCRFLVLKIPLKDVSLLRDAESIDELFKDGDFEDYGIED